MSRHGTANASGRATSPLDHELLIRIIASAALAVVMLGGVSLWSAEYVTVAWIVSSIGPAYSQVQSISCSADPTSCPVFSITAAGGLTAQEDVYAFAHRTLRGDGYLVARVAEISGVTSALAGLSIRGSMTPGAAQIPLLQTAGGGLLVREAGPGERPGLPVECHRAVPNCLAPLGAEGTDDFPGPVGGRHAVGLFQGRRYDLPEPAYAGLAVSSQRPDAMATATLSHVQMVPLSTLPDGWTKVDSGGSAGSQARYSQPTWTISQWRPARRPRRASLSCFNVWPATPRLPSA